MSKSSSGSSFQSFQMAQLKEMIDKLPKEYRDAMNVGIVVEVGNLKNKLSDQIYDSKKEELIESLNTQINFRVSKALQDPKYATIKKDIIFYKNAYEKEAANVNEIITATNKLNHDLYQPLKNLKKSLNEHFLEFKKNIENVKIPHDGINEGVESIKKNEIEENKKKEFEENKNELDKSVESYKNKAMEFFKEYNIMNEGLSTNIGDFLKTFIELKNNIAELKQEITNGFNIFENISPELENLDDQQNIRKLTEKLLFPLNKITDLISKSRQIIPNPQPPGEVITNQGKGNKDNLSETMINICSDLKSKANNISQKINDIRMKVNLKSIEIPPLELKEPDVKKINDNIEQTMDKIEKTKEVNKKIQDELLKKTKDFLNQTRLDIIFIIDCTNSVHLYLEEIKSNFTNMIQKIQASCPMATIYIGFVGYLDILDLMLDDEYINIDFTTNIDDITEKIKTLNSHGGGDVAEDIYGAFDLALKKDWQGISRFAILAADAPCHGFEFHGKNENNYDNYPNGYPENSDIKKLVREFAEKDISLFCAKFSDDTDKMFNIFKEEYEKGKKEGARCEFTMTSCENLCEIIEEKATKVYQVNRKEE